MRSPMTTIGANSSTFVCVLFSEAYGTQQFAGILGVGDFANMKALAQSLDEGLKDDDMSVRFYPMKSDPLEYIEEITKK